MVVESGERLVESGARLTGSDFQQWPDEDAGGRVAIRHISAMLKEAPETCAITENAASWAKYAESAILRLDAFSADMRATRRHRLRFYSQSSSVYAPFYGRRRKSLRGAPNIAPLLAPRNLGALAARCIA